MVYAGVEDKIIVNEENKKVNVEIPFHSDNFVKIDYDHPTTISHRETKYKYTLTIHPAWHGPQINIRFLDGSERNISLIMEEKSLYIEGRSYGKVIKDFPEIEMWIRYPLPTVKKDP
jgi:hypothetical protein